MGPADLDRRGDSIADAGAEELTVRDAVDADAPTLLAIYAPFVERSTVSFETAVPSIDDFVERMRRCSRGWAWLVAEQAGRCVGYAYGSAHRERAAYRWSVETSAYVDPAWQRRGVAGSLYRALFRRLATRGSCNAYAGVTLPNDASLAFHRSLGFAPIGVFPRVGYKFGAWHDVAWFHRPLRDEPPPEVP